MRLNFMTGDEEQVIKATQTEKNIDLKPELPSEVKWKGHLKLPVPSEDTDYLLKFEVFNKASDEVISSG